VNSRSIRKRGGAPRRRARPERQPERVRLLAAAGAAARVAYAPYSNFRVGAALLTRSGRIFTGCNVENASYGLTVCAERVALFSAVAAGERRFKALAVVAGGAGPAWPCGACRQALAEFCGADLPIHLAASKRPAAPKSVRLGALLPKVFRL
jgi:cytidine deaminase